MAAPRLNMAQRDYQASRISSGGALAATRFSTIRELRGQALPCERPEGKPKSPACCKKARQDLTIGHRSGILAAYPLVGTRLFLEGISQPFVEATEERLAQPV